MYLYTMLAVWKACVKGIVEHQSNGLGYAAEDFRILAEAVGLFFCFFFLGREPLGLEKGSESPPRTSLWPLALFGTAIALLSLPRSSSHLRKNAAGSVHPAQPTSRPSDKADCLILHNVPPSLGQRANPDRDKDDTPKWKKRADVSIAIGTIGLLLVNVFLLFATKNATRIASRQLEMADRPWLRDDVIPKANFIFDKGSISWGVLIKGENVGHSVATGVFAEATLIALHGADYVDGPTKELNKFCDRFPNSRTKPPNQWGVSVFPNDFTEIPYAVIMMADDVERASVDGGTALGNSIFPMLIGCIDYQYSTSDKRHQTRFIYDVFYKDLEAATPQPFISMGKTLPVAGMILKRHSISGHFAY